MAYLYLALAIIAEVVATTFMKWSEGFTRLGPSLVTVTGYLIAFFFLSLTLKTIPTGIVYAIWSGVGIRALRARLTRRLRSAAALLTGLSPRSNC